MVGVSCNRLAELCGVERGRCGVSEWRWWRGEEEGGGWWGVGGEVVRERRRVRTGRLCCDPRHRMLMASKLSILKTMSH